MDVKRSNGRNKLYAALDRGDYKTARRILKKHPGYVKDATQYVRATGATLRSPKNLKMGDALFSVKSVTSAGLLTLGKKR